MLVEPRVAPRKTGDQRRVSEGHAEQVTAQERQDDPRDCHREGLPPYRQQFLEVGGKAGLEQEDDDADFGEEREYVRVRIHEPEDTRAQNGAGDEFPQNRRLADAAGELPQ